jgi:hypothetical protein
MTQRLHPLTAALAATLLLFTATRASATEPDNSGTEVAVDVQQMTSPNGERISQYMCAVRVALNGELILAPKLQTQQGVEVTTTGALDSGTRVTLRLLISSPDQLTYDVLIKPSQDRPEHHRATIRFKS